MERKIPNKTEKPSKKQERERRKKEKSLKTASPSTRLRKAVGRGGHPMSSCPRNWGLGGLTGADGGGEMGTGSHSKVTRGQGPCFQLLADVHGRKVLRTCLAWRVSQNLLMDLALVWQEDALQAVVTVVEVEKMWWGWSPEPEVRGQVEAQGGWGVTDKATGHCVGCH